MASPKLAALELTAGERQVLAGWARRRKTAQALALRFEDRAGVRGRGAE